MKTVTIYTDGACSGNPGPGGWGAILQYGKHQKELSGGEEQTTNNRMELTGVITALEALKEPCVVELYSDSKYVIDALEQGWAKSWRAKGWRKPDKKPALNPDLWERLLELCEVHQVNLHWVKGHADNAFNNRCDKLAVMESQKFLAHEGGPRKAEGLCGERTSKGAERALAVGQDERCGLCEDALSNSAEGAEKNKKKEGTNMAGKFKIGATKNGGYKFNLVASNGQVIASSQTYKTLDTCKAGIESVRKNCGAHVEDQTKEGFEELTHPKFEVYQDKAGEFRFRLKARNGEIIVTGEGYKAKDSCLNGIASIGKNAPDAEEVMEEE